MDIVKTVVYDRIPVTLVHPRFPRDITVVYLLLPRSAEARRLVLEPNLTWLTRLRSCLTESHSLMTQLDTFFEQLTWKQMNHVQVDVKALEECKDVQIDAVQAGDYDLRILFTLFPHSMSDEMFVAQLCSSFP